MRNSAAYQNYKEVMKSLGFFGAVVPAKFYKFWDDILSEGERCVILESAGMTSTRPNRPLMSYSADLQKRLVMQIQRACEWGKMLNEALL